MRGIYMRGNICNVVFGSFPCTVLYSICKVTILVDDRLLRLQRARPRG